MAFTKNVAVTGFTFALVNKTTGDAVTTGTVTGYVTLDGGLQAALAGTPVHEGNGQWSVNLTAAEMNGDIVGLLFVHASAVLVEITIKTTTASAASGASSPGSVSGVTLYSSEADVEFVWSEFGVTVRADDDHNGVADSGLVLLALQKAATDVNLYLLKKYTVAVIAASTWVRWASAYFAAVTLGRRRGMSVPDGMLAQAQEYLDELKLIRDGEQPLMGDSGMATPRHDVSGAVTNFGYDGRFKRAKVRRVPSTSTGGTPTGKHHDVIDVNLF